MFNMLLKSQQKGCSTINPKDSTTLNRGESNWDSLIGLIQSREDIDLIVLKT